MLNPDHNLISDSYGYKKELFSGFFGHGGFGFH